MIKHVRIDERLIHGQVATVWVNSIGCNRIIVANNDSVKDEMQIVALKLACPTGVKLSVLSLNKAVVNINSGKYDNDKVFLITKNISDFKTLIDEGLKVESINVGNLSHKEGQIKIKKTVSLSEFDITVIHEFIEKGIRITAQMLPNEPDSSIAEFIRKVI